MNGLRPSRAADSALRPSAPPPAMASRQPTLPQRQTTAGSSVTCMWPTSPAEPWAPRWSLPLTMMPAPMPVPIFTNTTLSWPRAIPAHVHVVVDPDRDVVLREPLAQRIAVPPRHDRRGDRQAGVELDRSRHTDADSPERARRLFDLVQGLREELFDPGEDCVRAGSDVARLLELDEDRAGQVRNRDVHARRTEVGDEQVARVGPQPNEAWCPPARRRPEVALGEDAVRDQLAHALGDDGPAEPGRVHQRRPRARPVAADVVEHADDPLEAILDRHERPHHRGDTTPSARAFASPRQTSIAQRQKSAGLNPAAQAPRPGVSRARHTPRRRAGRSAPCRRAPRSSAPVAALRVRAGAPRSAP